MLLVLLIFSEDIKFLLCLVDSAVCLWQYAALYFNSAVCMSWITIHWLLYRLTLFCNVNVKWNVNASACVIGQFECSLKRLKVTWLVLLCLLSVVPYAAVVCLTGVDTPCTNIAVWSTDECNHVRDWHLLHWLSFFDLVWPLVYYTLCLE